MAAAAAALSPGGLDADFTRALDELGLEFETFRTSPAMRAFLAAVVDRILLPRLRKSSIPIRTSLKIRIDFVLKAIISSLCVPTIYSAVLGIGKSGLGDYINDSQNVKLYNKIKAILCQALRFLQIAEESMFRCGK